jgi:hypothetical protein
MGAGFEHVVTRVTGSTSTTRSTAARTALAASFTFTRRDPDTAMARQRLSFAAAWHFLHCSWEFLFGLNFRDDIPRAERRARPPEAA